MYLYEHINWTQFSWDDSIIMPLVEGARFAQGKLLGMAEGLGFDLDANFEADVIADELLASSRIEGVELDATKVRSSVAKQLGLEEDALIDTHSVDDAVSVMIDATRNYKKPLSQEMLEGWHNALFPTGYSGLYKIDVGKYRSHPMSVQSGALGHEKIHYEAPEAAEVPRMMSDFIRWFNEPCSQKLIKAGIAHLWFLTIHPFDDGNGRLARALTEKLLSQSDGSPRRFYGMATYILSHRKDYYQAIERAQKGTSDITKWLTWFLDALQGSIYQSEQLVRGAIKRSEWWQLASGISLNERQRKMLSKLLGSFEGKLTTAKWAKICKTSDDTALRDINDLIAKGLLVRDERAKGRSTSYLLADIM